MPSARRWRSGMVMCYAFLSKRVRHSDIQASKTAGCLIDPRLRTKDARPSEYVCSCSITLHLGLYEHPSCRNSSLFIIVLRLFFRYYLVHDLCITAGQKPYYENLRPCGCAVCKQMYSSSFELERLMDCSKYRRQRCRGDCRSGSHPLIRDVLHMLAASAGISFTHTVR